MLNYIDFWVMKSKKTSAPKNGTIQDITRKNIDTIARVEEIAQKERTFGERVADKVAAVIGSWTFIITQSAILACWVALNIVGWVQHWDPYPFILLNLALSFQAAYASPIIMMSQNRQARLFERRNHLDLQINLLSEQENTEMLRLLRKLCEHANISIDDEVEKVLEEQTKPDRILKDIAETVT